MHGYLVIDRHAPYPGRQASPAFFGKASAKHRLKALRHQPEPDADYAVRNTYRLLSRNFYWALSAPYRAARRLVRRLQAPPAAPHAATPALHQVWPPPAKPRAVA